MSKEGKNQKSGIETVDDLEARYPQLVGQIRDSVVAEIEDWPAKQVRGKLPELYHRIGAEIGLGKKGTDLSKPGFLLEESFFVKGESGHMDKHKGDPFSASTLRTYMRLKNISGLELPFVLPFKDSFTKEALRHYILISEGGGDYGRAKIAREAMKKCK